MLEDGGRRCVNGPVKPDARRPRRRQRDSSQRWRERRDRRSNRRSRRPGSRSDHTPYETEPDNALGDWFHAVSLSFPHDVVDRFTRLSHHAPTIVVIYLERPAVLTEIEPHAVALVGEYAASDRVVLDAIQGKSGFSGTHPFDLPRSMEAIGKSREDIPFDTPDPLPLRPWAETACGCSRTVERFVDREGAADERARGSGSNSAAART